MKRIYLLTVLLLISFTAVSEARMDVSLYGTSFKLGDEGTLYGGGLMISAPVPVRNLLPGINIYFDTAFTSKLDDADEPEETLRLYIPFSAGLEYSYQIMSSRTYALFSTGIGAYYFKMDRPKHYGAFINYSETETINTWGPLGTINLGFLYVLSQRTALFLNAGYRISYFDEKRIEDTFPAGYCLNAGVRIAITGKNRSLDYE